METSAVMQMSLCSHLKSESAVQVVCDGGRDVALCHSVVAGIGEALATAAALRCF